MKLQQHRQHQIRTFTVSRQRTGQQASLMLRRRRTTSLPLLWVVVVTNAILFHTLLLLALLLSLPVLNIVMVAAQENPCAMEVYAFNDLDSCTGSSNPATARALLVADGQCRSVMSTASVSPTTDELAYNLLPGNYRAECINSTAVRFIESGCIADQCNSTSLLTGATCDRNNEIAASLYSRLVVPEYITYPNRDSSYICTQANGSNTTVSFVIFGNCSSPSCMVPTPAPLAPVAPSSPPTVTTTPPTTPAPILIITPPSTPSSPTAPTTISNAPTNFPNENPTIGPDTTPNGPTTTTTTPPQSPPQSQPQAAAPIQPSVPTKPTGMTPSNDNDNNVTNPSTNENLNSTSSNSNSSTLIAGVASGVALVAVLLAVFLLYRKRQNHRDVNDNYNHKNVVHDDGFGGSHNSHSDPHLRPLYPGVGGGGSQHQYVSTKDDSTAQQYAATTNEIWVDPNADDVSTLGGGTLPNEFVFGQDEPTASVNMDYDYNRNQYRMPDAEERTQSQFTTASNPTTFTNFSKLGLLGQADFAADDDHSFEEQFAELDNDIRSTQKYDTPQQYANNNSNNDNNNGLSNRVKPFEVRAPPGKLGMVVDTPNGGVPVVRAIKADSVLNGSVQVGDRLISVDHVNVTSMSALEVSNLISLKQHQQRLLIFCRLTPP